MNCKRLPNNNRSNHQDVFRIKIIINFYSDKSKKKHSLNRLWSRFFHVPNADNSNYNLQNIIGSKDTHTQTHAYIMVKLSMIIMISFI